MSAGVYTALMDLIALLSTQGDVVEARILNLGRAHRPKGGLRGRVEAFSRAARRRLVEFMARLDVKSSRVVFVTLTFSLIPTHEKALAAFKRFTMRMRRRFPQASALWRKERQKRGAFHYHMLWFNLPYIPQDELQTIWTACTQEALSIVDIRLVKNKKAAMAYVSKYIAKCDDPPGPPSLEDIAYQHAPLPPDEGRWWGVFNRKHIPLGALVEILIEDNQELENFFEMVNRMSKGKGNHSMTRATLYNANAAFIFASVVGKVALRGTTCWDRLVELVRWRWKNETQGRAGWGVNQ